MDSNIKFSIIISCFNQENVIENAINSVKNQSFDNFECIIVDDCSTDGSVNKIQKLVKNDARFKLIVNDKNLSVLMSRKAAIREACGEYVLFLDGDDIFFTDAFENINAFINNQREKYDVIDFAYQTVHYQTSFFPSKNENNKTRLENFSDNNIAPCLWKSVYKSDLLKLVEKQLPELYVNIGEDNLFQTIISYNVNKYSYSDIFLIKYNNINGVSTKKASFLDNKTFIDSTVLIKNVLIDFFISKNEKKGSEYTKKIIQNMLKFYIHRCKSNTCREDIYKSLGLLNIYFDAELLEELYPLYMIGPESLLNVVNYFSRKKLIKEIIKKSIRKIFEK